MLKIDNSIREIDNVIYRHLDNIETSSPGANVLKVTEHSQIRSEI